VHTRWFPIRTLSVVLLSTAAVYAQQGARPTGATNFITVSGCVERADQVAAPAATAQAVDADSLQFALLPTLPPADATRKQASGATTPRGVLYRLDADVATITPHVGHEVEIKGVVTAAATPAPGAGETMPFANAARLKVESIRTLAQTCAR